MDKFCNQCGAELLENGVCPNCSKEQDEAEVKEAVSEVKENTKEEPAPAEEKAEQPKEEPVKAEEETPEAEQSPSDENVVDVPQSDINEVKPTKFYYAFRRVGELLGHFFSKRAVDTITKQYNEPLPIWVILLPVCAVISAISMTLSFDGSRGFSIGAGGLFSGMKLSGLEIFLISFAMSVAVEFVYSLAVNFYLKFFKIKTKFKAAANLTMSAYIAVSVVDLFNIITIGSFNSESTALSSFGMIAFILLLYLGITKVLDGKKPFWSFFLMMTCASLAALLAALIVTCPIIVMRGLQELANTTVQF